MEWENYFNKMLKNKSSSKIIERIKMELSAVFLMLTVQLLKQRIFIERLLMKLLKFNLDWFWDEPIYKELINIGGGRERIMYHIKRAWPEMLTYKNLSKYIDSIHKTKNEIYEDFLTESKIEVRPGIKRLIKELREQSIKIGLVSSTSEINLLNLFRKRIKNRL